MESFKNWGWLEKVGVVLAIVIVAALMYYTTSGSSAFTMPPGGIGGFEKVYIATFGNDRNDGRTQDTAVRSFARALELNALNIVLVGETYVLPRKVEHLQASKGLLLDHGIILTSNQTPWEGAPSSTQGEGTTTILPSGTYAYLKFLNYGPESSLVASKFVDFGPGSYYFSEGMINERIAGV
jgi:hypothetical protein